MALAYLTISLMVAIGFKACVSSSRLKLDGNAYDGLVVAFSPEAATGRLEQLRMLPRIQAIIGDASTKLCRATEGRVFIRNYILLVPETWTDHSDWISAHLETFDAADVRVAAASPQHGDVPYTLQPEGCGKPGRYIHLTPTFLQLADTLPQGSRFLHEFAHLRYGVFDELGFPGSSLHPPFYLDDQRRVQPTGCTAGVRGQILMPDNSTCPVDAGTKLPDLWCRFQPGRNSSTKASIMAYDSLDSVDSFCKSDSADLGKRHNADAPSLQNALCGGRGTWDVIKEHPDFTQAHPPVDCNTVRSKCQASVRYDRRRTSRKCGRNITLVLDASDAMKTRDRYFRQLQQASRIIRDVAPDDTHVTVVTYNASAAVRVNVTSLSSLASRRQLLDTLLRLGDPGGAPALSQALTILKRLPLDKGSRVVILAAGSDAWHDPQFLADLAQRSIAMHTVAFGQQASPTLAELSRHTGGLFTYNSELHGTTAPESFLEYLRRDLNMCDDPPVIEAKRAVVSLTPASPLHTTEVYIDSTNGSRTSFTFTLPQGRHVDVKLRSPDGHCRGASVCNKDTKFNIVRCLCNSTQSGVWQYTLSTGNGSADVLTAVTSHPSKAGNVIQMTTWLSSRDVNASQSATVYAHVRQGHAPVLSANVTATVETPGGSLINIQLHDTGRMGDNVEDDGVYTGQFSHFSNNGSYQIDVTARATQRTAVVISGSTISSTSHNPRRPDGTGRRFTGTFLRTSSPGALWVQGFRPGVDQIPPGRVNDLQIRSFDCKRGAATLQWTSPGDDGYSGRASSYDMRISVSAKSLRDNFSAAVQVTPSMFLGGDMTPLPAGERHQMEITLPIPWHGQTYVVGMVAVDDSRHRSLMSNLASIPCDPNNIVPPVSTTATSTSHIDPASVRDKGTNMIIIIACVVCGVLVSIGVAAGVAIYRWKKHSARLRAISPHSPFKAFRDLEGKGEIGPARFIPMAMRKGQLV